MWVLGGVAGSPIDPRFSPRKLRQRGPIGHEFKEMPKSPPSSPSPLRSVEVLTFPAVQLLDVTGPVQVFASANDLVANAGGPQPYRVNLVTQGGQGVVSSAGVAL